MNKIIQKLRDHRLVYLSAAVGLLLILFPKEFTGIAPYVISAVLIVRVILTLFIKRGNDKFAKRLVLGPATPGDCFVSLVLCGMMIAYGAGSIGPLGSIWAILSLLEAGRELDEMVHEHRYPPIRLIIMLIMTVLAILLLFDPEEHFAFHVRILGIEIILSACQWLGLFKRFGIKEHTEGGE